MKTLFAALSVCWLALVSGLSLCSAAEVSFQSHAPMRPLPAPSARPLPANAIYFADAKKGADTNDGTNERPWKTITYALTKLAPGDTLCLRGGTYYEAVSVSVSGTADKPITIRSHPGELAIIDAGLREFFEDPASAWEPFPEGAEGEFRSTKTYSSGGGFGNFGDSMIPFHRYMTFADLRSKSELWRPELENRANDTIGIYCGPGAYRDPETGRIHIRLAHTELEGLGARAYRGETDPRKLPLVIAGHEIALHLAKAGHVRIQDLVIRGAQRCAVEISDCENIELDGITIYGGSSTLRTSRVRGLRLIDSALRGLGAPWHSRFHHKDRAGAGYLVIADGSDFEFGHCELTDNHDFLSLNGVKEMRFHHNFVENFNDDGLEPGPKREHGRILIYQNYISQVLSPFTAHGKKPIPVVADEGSGVYIYRNIIDLRHGIYKTPPEKPDPSGAYLDDPIGIVDHDHGSPVHPIYYVYQNTFLMRNGAARGTYAFTWGGHTRDTTRRVFNNIFLQMEGLPGAGFAALRASDDFQSDGNLMWSIKQGPSYKDAFLSKFRQSPLFEESKKQYAPGWTTNDRFADPKFVSFDESGKMASDLRLQKDSPAIHAGIVIPAEWPDPLRKKDAGQPDIGALSADAEIPHFGIYGRMQLPASVITAKAE